MAQTPRLRPLNQTSANVSCDWWYDIDECYVVEKTTSSCPTPIHDTGLPNLCHVPPSHNLQWTGTPQLLDVLWGILKGSWGVLGVGSLSFPSSPSLSKFAVGPVESARMPHERGIGNVLRSSTFIRIGAMLYTYFLGNLCIKKHVSIYIYRYMCIYIYI